MTSKATPLQSATDCSTVFAIVLPAGIAILMLIFAGIAADMSSVDIWPLFAPYFSSAAAISVLAVLSYAFFEMSKLARIRADAPVATVRKKLIERAPLLILPAVVLPAFLIGYTASKCAIQFLVGYSWDSFFANADRFIFRDDVWHLTRRLLGNSQSGLLEWFYTVGWGGAFFFTANAIALLGSKRFVGIYFTAMLATWFVGGCILAYSFSAAGPVFAGLFDPALVGRFVAMHHTLDASLGAGPISFTQRYLASIVHVRVAVKGGGISAMPSMHLATASIYVLAAKRTRWFIPSILFWLTIFVASGYFGYHYWVDGIAAAVVSAVLWHVTEGIYGAAVKASSDLRSAPAEAAPATAN
jgi:hypothetical protein